MKTKINDRLRMQHVHRWTIVNTIKQQSLAEHTLGVALIAQEICSKLGIDDAMALRMALEHDESEIYTGDLPSPFKTKMHNIGWSVSDQFDDCKYYMKAKGFYSKIVKAADVIESAFFLSEHKLGDHADQVYGKITSRLHQIIDDCDDDLADAITKTANDVFSGDYIYV